MPSWESWFTYKGIPPLFTNLSVSHWLLPISSIIIFWKLLLLLILLTVLIMILLLLVYLGAFPLKIIQAMYVYKASFHLPQHSASANSFSNHHQITYTTWNSPFLTHGCLIQRIKHKVSLYRTYKEYTMCPAHPRVKSLRIHISSPHAGFFKK